MPRNQLTWCMHASQTAAANSANTPVSRERGGGAEPQVPTLCHSDAHAARPVGWRRQHRCANRVVMPAALQAAVDIDGHHLQQQRWTDRCSAAECWGFHRNASCFRCPQQQHTPTRTAASATYLLLLWLLHQAGALGVCGQGCGGQQPNREQRQNGGRTHAGTAGHY